MSFCVILRVLSKVGKLPDQHILHGALVLVSEVRHVHGGAARADPVGADWTGVPGSEPGDVCPLREAVRVENIKNEWKSPFQGEGSHN